MSKVPNQLTFQILDRHYAQRKAVESWKIEVELELRQYKNDSMESILNMYVVFKLRRFFTCQYCEGKCATIWIH